MAESCDRIKDEFQFLQAQYHRYGGGGTSGLGPSPHLLPPPSFPRPPPAASHRSAFRSLKVEYDKLANEKTEMQRHYVMVRGVGGKHG